MPHSGPTAISSGRSVRRVAIPGIAAGLDVCSRPDDGPMKRFVLYLLIVPLAVPFIKVELDSLIYDIYDYLLYGNAFFVVDGLFGVRLMLRSPTAFFFGAYLNWVLPALAVATADRLVRSKGVRRLGAIAAAGWISTTLIVVALYAPFPMGWQWGMLRPGFACAIAAVACFLLLELTGERVGKVASTARKAIHVLRQWPGRGSE